MSDHGGDHCDDGDQDGDVFMVIDEKCGKGLEALPVPQDAYGDMILSVVSCVLYVLNFVAQIWLSLIILVNTIAMEKEKLYKHGIGDLRAELDKAVALGRPLAEGTEALRLCRGSHVHTQPAYLLVVFLWYTRMLQELAEAAWLITVFWHMANRADAAAAPRARSLGSSSRDELDCSSSEGETSQDSFYHKLQRTSCSTARMIRERGLSSDGSPYWEIVCLSPGLRCFLLLGIAVPKFVIGFWISWIGSQFLMLASTTAALVLKTLCCAFFVNVDELLFRSFVSEAKKRKVSRTTLLFRLRRNEDWEHYGSTLFRMAFVVCMVSITYFGVFHEVVGFRYACLRYKRYFNQLETGEHNLDWYLF